MVFWISRFHYLVQLLGHLHHYSPNDANGGLSLNYDREGELDEQCCLAQLNGKKHYVDAKVILQSENAECLDENGKKVAIGIGFQVTR